MARTAGRLGASFFELLGRTWQFETIGADRLAALRAEGAPRLLVLWHRDLLPLLWFHRGYPTTIVVSRSSDGGYLAQVAQKWAYNVIRGSSSSGGTSVLKGLIRVLEEGGEAALAPDGPRGPACRVKPGAVLAALRTGAFVVAVAAWASGAWRAGSWDRMVVPYPFARIRIAYSRPVRLAAQGADPAAGVGLVEAALREAVTLARG
ncbi:hypothetical protein HRbin33_02367 [bacterium HR33]|nr:hypothetical protein HRbin33_02367 [bacterium HR33]